MLKAVTTFALIILLYFAARAAEIPRFDVEEMCRRQAVFQTGSQAPAEAREIFRKSCGRQQQDAYDTVKDEWPKLTQNDQRNFIKASGSTGIYRSMQYCVDGWYSHRADEQRTRLTGSFHY